MFFFIHIKEFYYKFFSKRYENGQWIAQSFRNPNFSANSNTYSVIGSHEWTFHQDSKANNLY